MMLTKGSVVLSTAGHDKNKFYCVVEYSQDSVWIADGGERKLERPKRKNVKHIQATTTSIDLNLVRTNKQLRAALRPLNEAHRAPVNPREGGNRFCPKQM